MANSSSVRCLIRGLSCGMLLSLCGCMAYEQVSDDAVIYKNSPLLPLMLLGFGIAAGVIGCGMVFESVRALIPKRRPKKRKNSPIPSSSTPDISLKAIGGLGVGCLAVVIGFGLTFIATPSSFLASITIRPDSIAIRDSALWFAASERVIPFSSIGGVNFEETEQLTRRGVRKKVIWHMSHAGGQERIEMVALHHAARPRFEQALAAYRQNPPAAAAAQMPAGDAGSPPPTEATANNIEAVGGASAAPQAHPGDPAAPGEEALTPIAMRGRFMRGTEVMFEPVKKGGFQAGTILSVYQQDLVKIQFSKDPTSAVIVPAAQVVVAAALPGTSPAPGTPVDGNSPLKPGMKLLAQYGDNWFPVQFKSFDGPRYATVIWLDEPPNLNSFPLSKMVLPPNQANVQPVINTASAVSSEMGDDRAASGSRNASATGTEAGPPPEEPGAPVNQTSELFVGQILLMEYARTWRQVEVLDLFPNGSVRIHWVGWSDSWDETVPRQKLRFRK